MHQVSISHADGSPMEDRATADAIIGASMEPGWKIIEDIDAEAGQWGMEIPAPVEAELNRTGHIIIQIPEAELEIIRDAR